MATSEITRSVVTLSPLDERNSVARNREITLDVTKQHSRGAEVSEERFPRVKENKAKEETTTAAAAGRGRGGGLKDVREGRTSRRRFLVALFVRFYEIQLRFCTTRDIVPRGTSLKRSVLDSVGEKKKKKKSCPAWYDKQLLEIIVCTNGRIRRLEGTVIFPIDIPYTK